MKNYDSDQISYEDIKKSKYLDSVINEVNLLNIFINSCVINFIYQSLRMHPSLNRMFRISQADYDFGDFKVKKGKKYCKMLTYLY